MLHSAPRPPIVLEGPYVNLELAVLALVLGSLGVTAVCRRLGVSSALVLVLGCGAAPASPPVAPRGLVREGTPDAVNLALEVE